MWTIILGILAVKILLVMALYAASLLYRLRKQNKALQQARQARIERLKDNIEIIANAMLNGDCNHSEGVLRLRMLLEPLGLKLSAYPAMYELFSVVEDMPTHEARSQLAKKERMRLDLTRESAEAKLEQEIILELRRLLSEMKQV